MIKLGEQVKDKLTGFKGTAIARAEYLYGCVWVCVVPKELHDSKPVEDTWFDEERLTSVVKKNVKEEEDVSQEVFDRSMRRGGPTPSMPKINVPRPSRA